jgi:NAD(P) transhydrogenase subunit alpha
MAALLIMLLVFALSFSVGYVLISKVPPLLHTPLMSGSNAISGITLVGAIGAVNFASWDQPVTCVLAFLGVALATVNVVGGYAVTDRMLQLFKKK